MNRFTPWMNWFHSWSGLLFGWLLFAVFLTGTLAVFDTEITAWMQPELHEITSDTRQDDGPASWPAQLMSPLVREGRDVSTDESLLRVKLQEKRTFSGQAIDPVTGARGDLSRHPGRRFLLSLSLWTAIRMAWCLVGWRRRNCDAYDPRHRVCSPRWTFKDIVKFRVRPISTRLVGCSQLDGFRGFRFIR